MTPYLTFWQRILAKLLWRYERKHGWGAGFDDDIDGAAWLLLDPEHASFSASYGLMRDYLYLRKAGETNE